MALASCGTEGPQGPQGIPGETPTIEISEDGYWVINGQKTDYKATVEDRGSSSVTVISQKESSVSACKTLYPTSTL